MLAKPLKTLPDFLGEAGYCPSCRLRKVACFCEHWPRVNNKLPLNILVHSEELKKDSNTTLLLWKALANCEMQVWQRTERVLNINVERAAVNTPLPVLLFPARIANAFQGESGRAHPMLDDTQLEGRQFLLLDGSWQQVKKMYRQSEELKHLPCYELRPDEHFPLGNFKLRRNQQEEGFCSAQAMALLLWRTGEETEARQLIQAYEQFSQHVLASRSNHKPVSLPDSWPLCLR
ncbi:DTW domain-containing protein [Pseudoteredinibacter isoporae]|uniref:tRNA-uridine aminocarboxypropyltransferase n=1 Tax=Pseudoteredinibacter isoporae TaxID=570281 RepID=A0A7X0JX49_9GAMM|nr:tRNA-uridine aminocarboxypropyltransferase [Pseudoteredinibacter isoporae]MBB6523313.1 hypothetical protein [Pseudoteredinibacter isoporae]NHO88827.1 DTW domain-containing protein [Pseudoteredinibacter isoporae]NIB24465.1 DTW domain-containing protein [Pseudoteredinibacter isoporae]